MKTLLRTLAPLLLLIIVTAAPAQDITGDITVRTIEILDSQMYHPGYTSSATILKSSNPALKGAIARLLLVRDDNTRLYSVQVTDIVLNGALIPATSTDATLPGGFLNKTGHAVQMRGDGHTPSLSGGTVFLPANTTIHFNIAPLGPPPPQQ